MTTTTITVSLAEADETYDAEYFQIEDGWMTLKTDAGKFVASFPAHSVTRVCTTQSTVLADAWEAGFQKGVEWCGQDKDPDSDKIDFTNPFRPDVPMPPRRQRDNNKPAK